MSILDNLENAWDDNLQFEHQNLAVNLFSQTCCNGCSCKTTSDHATQLELDL